MKLLPKNWADFQHYKDRAPPWIKLHKTLLDNFDFQSLPVASRALAPMLWLLASEHENGVIDAAPEKLAFRLRMTETQVRDSLKPLIDKGFFSVVEGDSDVLASRKRGAMPETEAEERQKRDRHAADFEIFYAAYPKKKKRPDAEKAWKHVDAPVADLIAAIKRQKDDADWQKEGGRYIPYPASWLNGRMWEDGGGEGASLHEWHETAPGINAKAKELGIPLQRADEQFPVYKARVIAAHTGATA